MAYFNPDETFGNMWRAMGKNIDWAEGPEGQKLLRAIKAKGSAPSFGTGNLYSDFQNDLLTGKSTVRDQVADMYKKYYGTGTSSTPTQSAPTRPAPSQSPAPKPKVDPQKFLDSKKASVQPKVTPPRPAVSPTPAPKVTPTPTPPPTTQIPNTSVHNVKIKPPTPTPPARGLVGGLLQRGAGLLTRGFGAAQALDGNAPASTRLIGAATVANPMLGFALSLGSGLGEWAEDNLPESDFVSGRGSGSAALSGKKQRRSGLQAISETIPQSLKVAPATPDTGNMTINEDGDYVSSDGGTVYSADGKTYTTGGVTYSRDGSGQAINPDTGKISETGYSIDPKTNKRTDTPEFIPERGEGTDDAPDGSEAKGTNTGFKGFSIEDINANLTAIGAGTLADATPFLSEALPVTKPGADQQQLANPSQPRNNSPTISPNGDPYAGPGFGVPANDAVVEGPSTPNPGAVVDTQSADNARSVSVPGEPRNWMEPRQKSWAETRREAFLSDAMDDKGSLAAVRAAHAATGAYDQMTPYGHKYAIRTGDDLQYVDRDTYKTYNRTGKLSAVDFKEGYASGVKSTLVPVSQPDITNPDAPVNPTPAGEFNMNNLAPNPPVPAGMNDEPVDVELTQTMKDRYFKHK